MVLTYSMSRHSKSIKSDPSVIKMEPIKSRLTNFLALYELCKEYLLKFCNTLNDDFANLR